MEINAIGWTDFDQLVITIVNTDRHNKSSVSLSLNPLPQVKIEHSSAKKECASSGASYEFSTKTEYGDVSDATYAWDFESKRFGDTDLPPKT